MILVYLDLDMTYVLFTANSSAHVLFPKSPELQALFSMLLSSPDYVDVMLSTALSPAVCKLK